MKKIIFLLFLSSVYLFSCKGNDEPITEKEFTIRYEADCTNSDLYSIKVTYSIGQVKSATDDENIKTQTVESPFIYQLTMKTGMVASLNVSPVSKLENDPNINRIVRAKIYVDGKLAKEVTSDVAAAAAVPLVE